ncbi:MAG: hypothetical protein AB8B87_08655 [Granulosicoccus sp.]
MHTGSRNFGISFADSNRPLNVLLSICAWVTGLSIFLLLLQPATISLYDEAIILTGALHWIHGNMPGVDFYTVYGPLQFFIVSLFLKLGDGNFIFSRILYSLILAIPIVVLSRLFIEKTLVERSLKYAFISGMLFFCTAFSSPSYPSHSLSLLVVLLLLLKLNDTLERTRILNSVCLSIILSLVFLLRPTVGVVLVIGLLCAIPFDAYNRNKFSAVWMLKELRSLITACAMCVVALIVINQQTQGSLVAVLDIILNLQSAIYASMRGLPFPGIHPGPQTIEAYAVFFAAYFPLLGMLCGACLYLCHLLGITALLANNSRTLFWLLFSSSLLYTLGMVRTDAPHLLPTIILSSATIGYTLSIIIKKSLKNRVWTGFFAVNLTLASLCIAICLWMFGWSTPANRPSVMQACKVQIMTQSLTDCLQVPENMSVVLPKLKEILSHDEKIFSANTRHDRIFINNMAYYAYSGHLPISFWAHMDPGVQTTAPIQLEIIDELVQYATENGRSIVVISNPAFKVEPNQSAVSSDVTLLDDYLRSCATLFVHDDSRILSCNS